VSKNAAPALTDPTMHRLNEDRALPRECEWKRGDGQPKRPSTLGPPRWLDQIAFSWRASWVAWSLITTLWVDSYDIRCNSIAPGILAS
jgi:hypothetical protein